MPETIVYFDIAAAIIMLITTPSMLMRHVRRDEAYYTYFLMSVLVTLTSIAAMCSELYDGFFGQSVANGVTPAGPQNFLHVMYFSLRVCNTPAYLVLIAAISDTTYRLRRNQLIKLAFWAPIIAVLLFIITNPIHHGVFTYVNGQRSRGPMIWVIYLSALYYSAWGISHLIRWRTILDADKFRALIGLYPLNLLAIFLQYLMPYCRIEMFFTAAAVLLASAFVFRPEDEIDILTNTLNYKAYEEMCQRAFVIEQPLCLVHIDIANKDRLRELAGPSAFRNIVRAVSSQVTTYLKQGDSLYYLRNGLFCISARNPDSALSLSIAQQSSREGRAAAEALPEQSMVVQLRTCITRIPTDISDFHTLQVFSQRIGHLIPEPCVITYEELSKRKSFLLEMNLADIVSRGINDRLFEVYYQPIWCVHDTCFRSAEALVRLNDPDFGFVSPGLFIPEAEQSGAILDIGRIILEKICEFLSTMDFDATQLNYVEVNLSVDQCVQPSLARDVVALLERHHIESKRINLEITETSSSYSQSIIDANVRALAKHGISLSLDDFGTGYSNLTRMLSLPFDLIKLDQTFVKDMESPDTRTVLADTITTMKKIGKEVLVEGVETEEQARILIDMGVDYMQGYLYARPMPEPDFVAFLNEHNN